MVRVTEYPGSKKYAVDKGAIIDLDTDKIVDYIDQVEIAIEYPESMLGICRVESVTISINGGRSSFNDQDIVDNAEFHSDTELIEALAERYGVSEDIIDVV